MIGLSRYERDLSIPGQLGDRELGLPGEEELAALVQKHLVADQGLVGPLRATLEHVRYKPGVAIAGTYVLSHSEGSRQIVTFKSHLGGKKRHVEREGRSGHRLLAACAPLHPHATTPDGRSELWCFPADPGLRGTVRLTDPRRTARWVDRLGGHAPLLIRVRPTVLRLRRYKHGRRAVYELDARLRGANGVREQRMYGIRVHSPRVAAESMRLREALSVQAPKLPVPRVVGTDRGAGMLLEEWLPGRAGGQGEFGLLSTALECVAQLHRAPVGSGHQRANLSRAPSSRLLQRLPGLARIPSSVLTPVTLPAMTWVHGDLHPDQVIVAGNRVGLLDLDALHVGSVEEDLASWIADQIALDRSLTPGDVEDLVITNYREHDGPQVDRMRLRSLTVVDLVDRAEAALRRIQFGAITLAHELLEVAVALTQVKGR